MLPAAQARTAVCGEQPGLTEEVQGACLSNHRATADAQLADSYLIDAQHLFRWVWSTAVLGVEHCCSGGCGDQAEGCWFPTWLPTCELCSRCQVFAT